MGVELASAAYDIYQTYKAFRSSSAEGAEALHATMMGAIAPGPGNAYRSGARAVDRMVGPRLLFEANPKHGATARGIVSAGVRNGQDMLDGSLNVKAGLRVGVGDGGMFNVFREHLPGRYHGYEVSWDKLSQEMRNTLIDSGVVNRRGRIK